MTSPREKPEPLSLKGEGREEISKLGGSNCLGGQGAVYTFFQVPSHLLFLSSLPPPPHSGIEERMCLQAEI